MPENINAIRGCIAAKKTTNKHEIVEERIVKLQCRHPRYTHAVISLILFVINSVYVRGKSLNIL